MSNENNTPQLSRRDFIKLAGLSVGVLLESCVGRKIIGDGGPYFTPSPRLKPTEEDIPTKTPVETKNSIFTATSPPTETPIPHYSSETLKQIVTSEESSFLADHKIARGDPSRSFVIMTYDDGHDDQDVQKIIDAYDNHGVKCTFFFTGDKLEKCAKSINLAIESGHEIGCHAYHHDPPLVQLSGSQIQKQFEGFFTVMDQIAPGYRVRLWRAPYGAINDKSIKIIADYGLQHVLWNVESGGVQPETFQILFTNYDLAARYYRTPNGLIVLSHAQRYYDINIVNEVVSEFINRGLTPVTVSEGMKPEDKWENTFSVNP